MWQKVTIWWFLLLFFPSYGNVFSWLSNVWHHRFMNLLTFEFDNWIRSHCTSSLFCLCNIYCLCCICNICCMCCFCNGLVLHLLEVFCWYCLQDYCSSKTKLFAFLLISHSINLVNCFSVARVNVMRPKALLADAAFIRGFSWYNYVSPMCFHFFIDL